MDDSLKKELYVQHPPGFGKQPHGERDNEAFYERAAEKIRLCLPRTVAAIPFVKKVYKKYGVALDRYLDYRSMHARDRDMLRAYYDPDLVEAVCLLVERGVPPAYACSAYGIARATLDGWMKDDEVAERIHAAEALDAAQNVAAVRRASDKSWKAAAWHLERRHPDEFGSSRSRGGRQRGPAVGDPNVIVKVVTLVPRQPEPEPRVVEARVVEHDKQKTIPAPDLEQPIVRRARRRREPEVAGPEVAAADEGDAV